MVPFGDGPSPYEYTKQIQCPILGSFGANDQGPSPEEVGNIEVELTKYNKESDFKIYPDATHGFFREGGEEFKPDAADDAWKRTLACFDTYLKQK